MRVRQHAQANSACHLGASDAVSGPADEVWVGRIPLHNLPQVAKVKGQCGTCKSSHLFSDTTAKKITREVPQEQACDSDGISPNTQPKSTTNALSIFVIGLC